MNDLIKLHDDAKKLLSKANKHRDTMRLMIRTDFTNPNIRNEKKHYSKMMNKYIKIVNEIQKLSYEKYI